MFPKLLHTHTLAVGTDIFSDGIFGLPARVVCKRLSILTPEANRPLNGYFG